VTRQVNENARRAACRQVPVGRHAVRAVPERDFCAAAGVAAWLTGVS